MRIGADECVGIEDIVFRKDTLCQELKVHLVDDTDSGRDNGECFECLLPPLEKLIALAVADELDLHVAIERSLTTGEIHLDGVVDDEINGHQWLDSRWIGALGDGGVAHGGDIYQEGHTSEVLQHDAGNGEWDLVVARVLRIPPGEVLDVSFGDLFSVAVAQQRLEHNTDGNRKAGNLAQALLFQRWE